ncbi:MAG: DUF167 domain-containing protein [Blastocatellia bacterium]|nr:DUF167 domain-containing protein [Blastocatellia bacterium]
MIPITEKGDGVSFAVRVQPRASRSGVAGEIDGALKLRLAAPPVDGEANEELIRLLAKLLDVPRAYISLLSGATSKNKIVLVRNISATTCRMKLEEVMMNNE